MKKNNGKAGAVIGLILSAIIACSTILLVLLKFDDLKILDWILVVIYAVIGLIGGYLCHNLLHELGHSIFAKLAGAKIFEIAFCGFVFKKGEKPKLNLKSGVGGWTSFLPKTPEKSKKVLTASLWGGLTGSCISRFISYGLFQLERFTSLYPLVVIFGFYNAVNFYLIVLNFLSLKDGTDGVYMITKNNKPNERFALKVADLEYQSHMLNGKTAKETGRLTFAPINFSTIFDVEKSLQTGDLLSAKEFIEKIISEGKIDDNGLIDLYLEDLFVSIVTKDDENIENKADKVIGYLLEPSNLLSYRVAIFYRRYTGETTWGDVLEKTYFKLIELCPLEGLKKQEREIYELYSK